MSDLSRKASNSLFQNGIEIRDILENYNFSNAQVLFDILLKDCLIISYSTDHTKVSTILIYNLKEKRIINQKDFDKKSIENLKVVNNKILLHLSYEEDDCLIIMDENLLIEKTKTEFGFSNLVGANESFIYTFDYYSSCLIILDWSFNSVETNLYFQTIDSTEPFYIECEKINRLNFIDMINDTYILNLKVDDNQNKVFIFDQNGCVVNSFKSAEIIETKKDVAIIRNWYDYIIALLENNFMKFFDIKGNQIEKERPLSFDIDLNKIDKFKIGDGKICFLDNNYKIHIKNMPLIKNYNTYYENNNENESTSENESTDENESNDEYGIKKIKL